MSVRAVWTVWCDHPGACGAWIDQEDDRVQAVEAAYACGWVKGRQPGRHFCPLHNPQALINRLEAGGFEVTTDDPVERVLA